MSETELPPLDAGLSPLKVESPQAAERATLARRFAALSGPFRPHDALRAAGAAADVEVAVSVSATLASACDTRLPGGAAWLMRATERWWDLKELAEAGELPAAMAWRREQGLDDAAGDLLAALGGDGMFAAAAIDASVAAAERGDMDRARLERLAAVLEWGGPLAPGYARLERIRAALNRAEETRRGDLLLEHGFHGREAARAGLADWIRRPATYPVQAMYVSGLPAIGKSTLLEHAVRQAATEGLAALVVRLDFDRPGLDVVDRVGLTAEVARQVAAQAPDAAVDLRLARLQAVASEEALLKGVAGRDRLPYQLMDALTGVLQTTGRTLLLVLDTLEVLRGRGETHPQALFNWLDALADAGVRPLVVIAAGRGDALGSCRDRVGRELALDRLEPGDAEPLLVELGVPPELRQNILERAGGNPLQLRLLGALAAEQGADAVRAAQDASASLYRSLESRLGGRYGSIARFAPLLRRVSRDALLEVLAPAASGPRLTADAADELWKELKEQVWLVKGEDPPGWLQLHHDLRLELIQKLHAEKARAAHRVHRRAAAWFARRLEAWAPAEALYHRLQATRWEDERALKDMNMEAGSDFRPDDLEELPEAARDAVRRAMGERSFEGRAAPAAAGGEVSPGAVEELRTLLSKGDLAEAAHFYERVFEPARSEPTGEAGEAAMTFLWRAGRWREARRLAAERAWTRPWDEGLADARPDAALARLEMQAEFDLAGLRRWLEGEGRRALVASLVRASKLDLYFGALRFAVGAAPVESPRGADPVAAVVELWGAGGSQAALQPALSVGRSRRERATRGRPALLDMPGRTLEAQTLASLSPYGDLGAWILKLTRDPRLRQLPAAQLAALPEAEGGGLSPGGGDAAAVLADLGLAAEWIAAAGFLLRDADLKLIGRSAERWRRTAAGLWSHGRRPHGWVGGAREGVDAVTQARVARLLADPSPTEAARRTLAAWAGGAPGAAQVLRRIDLRRVQARDGRHADEDPQVRTLRAASALMRRRTPAAFAPSLAVLAVLEHREEATSHERP